MAVINNSTLINCTPAEAFDYFVDIRNELEWNPDAVSMVKLTDGPVRQGTRFLAKWKSSTQIVRVVDNQVVGYRRTVAHGLAAGLGHRARAEQARSRRGVRW